MQNRVELPRTISGEAIDSGRVTTPAAAGTNFLQDSSKRWATDIHKNRLVRITGGAGAGQSVVIQGNSAQGLVIKNSWSVRLDTSSTYEIYGADIVTEFASLREALGRVLEVSEDSGEATGGSNNTLEDTSKSWGIDWSGGAIHIFKGGIEYIQGIVSNTATVITFDALPGGIAVAPGDKYAIRRPVTTTDVSDRAARLLGVVDSLTKWGGTALTGRDISLDLANLDIAISALRTEQRGFFEPKLNYGSSTGAALTVDLDTGLYGGRTQVEVWVKSSAAATFTVYGSRNGTDWRDTGLEIVLGAAGEDHIGFNNAYRYIRVSTSNANDNEIEIVSSR